MGDELCKATETDVRATEWKSMVCKKVQAQR